MLYDVNVIRIGSAALTIRVEADTAVQAEEKAVEQAHDSDYSGCAVDYEFDAGEAAEVPDEGTMPTGRYDIQHESDDEPTYIVKAGTEEEVVTLAPSLPWQLRRKLAETIVAELEK
jgi:hypothetical protein